MQGPGLSNSSIRSENALMLYLSKILPNAMAFLALPLANLTSMAKMTMHCRRACPKYMSHLAF
ncbi:hypothetical protein BJX96DRAFT_142729 [Aspergillus floccosus]